MFQESVSRKSRQCIKKVRLKNFQRVSLISLSKNEYLGTWINIRQNVEKNIFSRKSVFKKVNMDLFVFFCHIFYQYVFVFHLSHKVFFITHQKSQIPSENFFLKTYPKVFHFFDTFSISNDIFGLPNMFPLIWK